MSSQNKTRHSNTMQTKVITAIKRSEKRTISVPPRDNSTNTKPDQKAPITAPVTAIVEATNMESRRRWGLRATTPQNRIGMPSIMG